MKKLGSQHFDQKNRLSKVEGQIRGILKMIDEQRYSIDILNQIHSVQSALSAVEREIARNHIEGCVAKAIESGTSRERLKKMREIAELLDHITK